MLAVLLVLSLVVSLDVFWVLRQPGLTLAGDASCGILEHTHDDACGEQICVCTLTEEPHIHGESCYETVLREVEAEPQLMCQLSEDPHIHTDSCYETIFTECMEEMILICTDEDESHIHEDWCYEVLVAECVEETVLTCELVSEPHAHTDSCYDREVTALCEEQVLICSIPEEAHIHDDNCYEWEATCGYEEHVHRLDCYSDVNADVETQLDWQEMFADYPYTGNLREDLVNIAKTQVGYGESTRNFEVDSEGIRRGYTRYGAWYGAPYSDWSATFVAFCLHYAGADSQEAPGNIGADSMAERWAAQGRFLPAEDYVPAAGDLVFFTDNTMGIVTEVQSDTFCFIGGNIDDLVSSQILTLSHEGIAGWGCTEGLASLKGEPAEPDTTVPTDPEETEATLSTEPAETETTAPTEPAETEPPETPTTQDRAEVDLLDISNGPAVFLFEGGTKVPQIRRYALRSTRTITELLPYLEAHGGSYFFTLLDYNNQELPKDEQGNYVVQANTGYKLTISFNSPDGFKPGVYQYQIANGLMVDGGEGTFVLTDGTNVGSWVVTDTGLITLDFNEHMNSRTDITISSTLGIHFPEQNDPIDFDGLITVKVEPPPQQNAPTKLSKWGSPNTDAGKINWTIRIDGFADSQIPGNILTDQTALSDWSRPHSYTESDIAKGISFGVSDAQGGWHNWTVYADDPHLIWDENGWSYKIPKTVTCDYCGELELGNEGWSYYINYTSTPTALNTPGTFDYENKVTVDGQTAWGWSNFTHGSVAAQVTKTGSFVADAGGGAFLWEVQVTIPGRPEGQRADYSWFFMDEMKLYNDNGVHVGRVQNDINLAMVTATYNGTTIQIPRIQDATDQDLFAWDNAWTATENGISYNRTMNLLCRCQCTAETCHWTGCSEYWFQRDDGTWATNGFCQCWTEQQNMTFTFVYKTQDTNLIQSYGSLGYRVNNHAQLYHIPEGETSVRVSYADATVEIPNLFEKQLTHDFDGYTANYKVTVNEAKVPLTNGGPLTIHDEMTKTLAYVSGSLVITTEDANGNTGTLQQGVDYTVSYDGTGNQVDANGTEVHVLDIVILHPQPVMYILDYDTTLIIPPGTNSAVKYTNSATITLWGENIKDKTEDKVYAEINIAAKNYKVEMFKTCSTTGEPLGGATFGLYNENGGLITTEVTDANGELQFQSNIIEGIILRDHILYYMQELKAPPGYQLDDKKYWFCFCDSAADSCNTCEEVLEGLDAIRVPTERHGKVHVTNDIMHYDLPSTGGPGMYPFVLVGVTFITTSLVYEFIRRRKQERRGVG